MHPLSTWLGRVCMISAVVLPLGTAPAIGLSALGETRVSEASALQPTLNPQSDDRGSGRLWPLPANAEASYRGSGRINPMPPLPVAELLEIAAHRGTGRVMPLPPPSDVQIDTALSYRGSGRIQASRSTVA